MQIAAKVDGGSGGADVFLEEASTVAAGGGGGASTPKGGMMKTIVGVVKRVEESCERALSAAAASGDRMSGPPSSSLSSSMLVGGGGGGGDGGGLEDGLGEEERLTKLYMSAMRDLQYDEVEGPLSNYHAAYKSLMSKTVAANVKARTKRIMLEHADLSRSLPLNWSSSVWVRRSSERADSVQAVISGPSETPYSNGLFLFDSYFPDQYPTVPPMFNLQTTGGGSVRFNPNLCTLL